VIDYLITQLGNVIMICISQSTSCKVYLHIFIGKTWSNIVFN